MYLYLFISYFSSVFNNSCIVCQPSTAHFTLAGMWAISCNTEASSSSSRSSSVILPLIILRNRSARCNASSLLLPMTSSSIMSAEAWEMAQPSPSKAPSTTTPSSTFSSRKMSSPQLGLTPSNTRFASSSLCL